MCGQIARVQAITSALEDAREKKKKRKKIIVPWATEWNDRERSSIQSHKIKPQKIDFENFNEKTKIENQQNYLKVVAIALQC